MTTAPTNPTIDAINGLCWAASRFNLSRFCEVLGWPEDDYAEAKFRDFQQAARLLGRFDNDVLTRLSAAGRAA